MFARFLALLALLYGAAGLFVSWLRAEPQAFEGVATYAPTSFLEAVNRFFPDSVYQPYQPGEEELLPTPQRGYLLSLAALAAGAWYLFASPAPRR